MAKAPTKAMAKALGGAKASSSKKPAGCAPPVTRVSVSDTRGTERSVEVRKIENGFIVRESVYNPKKGYSSTERFTDKAPTLAVKDVKG